MGEKSEGAQVEELLALIEQSRDEGDPEREVGQSLKLYEILKRRTPQDADTFQVAFGIAQIYDGQLDNMGAAVTYYEEALTILETLSTEATTWGVYMRVTTLGALALCYENLDQLEEADTYFNRAISAYEQHCEQAMASDTDEENASETKLALLADLNASAAMIYYHYAGSLLAQEDCEEVKNLTEAALMLAEHSSMPSEDLEELQRCIHDLWLDMANKE
ncbi:hypothetical protein BBO99_00001798 [Phytophthora kernoviae]|uniref:MalT-like TPR region domain-containing protein n=2 Tax=Phytophthora kernoviae TaxID=325452 RepID=A0A3R7H720_9STRA|nr:hypothetical protein G195_002568 [Phytophthora kernoviae 00238/432]KAG2527564.1 hypothetical protein JM16_003351 [Phytophthora kernoviae]KAG2532053.1 hypothetical protein JM18_001433 [Phytophthora kernoviae]RLN27164.1 hypothetical protein BBI17_001569 [Phytophthora kernoviae]RLN83819.1 hypothetical protein BBO99_00001798 [Phytophthora kernoviae]